MELQRIGDDKLKVLLTPYDMMKHHLTPEKLNYENTETRKAIWDILDDAKHETGFDAASGRICIEVYPEKSGGCIIYISKIEKDEDEQKETVKEKSAFFRFRAAEPMLQVCKYLLHIGYTGKSAAFFEEWDGGFRYYLELAAKSVSGSTKKTRYLGEYPFISEFGTRLDGGGVSCYIEEHAVPIVREKAVPILGEIANENAGNPR